MEKGQKKIMIFGTFDGLHPGHLNFFKQARSLSKESFLMVSVARDKNVYKIKGYYPDKKEKDRVSLLKKSKLFDRVVLSGSNNYLQHIQKNAPDVIALGYDQKAYVSELRKDIKNIGLQVRIVRMKPYKEKIYKNHLLKNKR